MNFNFTNILLFVSLLLFVSCNSSNNIIDISSEDAERKIQEALIKTKPGSIIILGEGKVTFQKRLTLDVANITIKGQGKDKTILSFKDQKVGAEGLYVSQGNFTVEDLAIEDTKGDALKIKGASGVTIRNVRIEWTNGADEKNGAYGLYPVECKNVLIEHCYVRGASDAGIYVGQSEKIIVRNNYVTENVAGIEIENSKYADVYKNTTTKNTGGILVFDLPNLPLQGGRNTRVFDNEVIDNNCVNFAPKGTTVANVPSGTGVMIMANDYVEVFNNKIENHNTTGIAIVSYLILGKKYEDANYDPFPQAIYIHNNTIVNSGSKPQGEMGKIVGSLFPKVPDILWDGMINNQKYTTGELPKEMGIWIKENGDATFANFNLASLQKGQPKIITDINKYTGELPSLSKVSLGKR